MQQCSEQWGWILKDVPSTDGVSAYEVALPPWGRDAVDALCDCNGYVYRGQCRHQVLAAQMICDWETGTDPEQTNEQQAKRICPRCGSKTRILT